jgi:hypothetical protein
MIIQILLNFILFITICTCITGKLSPGVTFGMMFGPQAETEEWSSDNDR